MLLVEILVYRCPFLTHELIKEVPTKPGSSNRQIHIVSFRINLGEHTVTVITILTMITIARM